MVHRSDRWRRVRSLYHRRPAWIDTLLAGLVPGVLLGIQLAGLLLFLNSHLGLRPATLLPLALVYGGALGVLGLVLQLPWTARRPDRARRLLPWGVTAALLLAAVLDAAHASYYAYYLPPGINTRLLKAALVLATTALIAFYTALLHTLHRRRYGLRSRLGFVLIALASLYVVVERLQSYEAQPDPSRLAAVSGERPALHLAVVALEGATLDAILPLAEQGRVPFLATMLRQGSAGRLETFDPNRREPLWTSLVTGKLPYRHGIVATRTWPAPLLGEEARLRLLPAGIAFESWGTLGLTPRPVERGQLRSLTLPQVLSRLGAPAASIGWPLTTPAPAGLAFSVSEAFFGQPRSRRHGARPIDVAERAQLFEISPDELAPLVEERFGAAAPPVVPLALSEDLWRQSLALYLLEQNPQVSAHFIALPGLGQVSLETFGGYAQVQFEGGGSAAARRAHEVLAAYYGTIDQYLAAIWEALPEPRLLVVVSPSGAEPLGALGRLLWRAPREHGTLSAGEDGVLLMLGEDVRPGVRLSGGQLVDVVPTLLYAFGYPIAKDLDGKVLTAAFEPRRIARQPLTVVPTYDVLPPRESD